MTEWIVAGIVVLLVISFFVVRRTGWTSPITFVKGHYETDLTLRTRMTEDEVRDAVRNRDDQDLAP